MWSESVIPKESPELTDVRTEILRRLMSVTVYRTVQKNSRFTQHFPGSAKLIICWNVLYACCPGCAACGKWAAMGPWILHNRRAELFVAK